MGRTLPIGVTSVLRRPAEGLHRLCLRERRKGAAGRGARRGGPGDRPRRRGRRKRDRVLDRSALRGREEGGGRGPQLPRWIGHGGPESGG
jgi:hypothetical protein